MVNDELDVVQYVVEWKGTGRSFRPPFNPKNAAEADAFFVESLEEWRDELKVGAFHGLDAQLRLTPSGFIAGQVYSLRSFDGSTIWDILCV